MLMAMSFSGWNFLKPWVGDKSPANSDDQFGS